MSKKKHLILEREKIFQKIERIAYQIVENNYEAKEMVVIGIEPNGTVMAELLIDEMKKITDINCDLFALTLDKVNPGPIEIKPELKEAKIKNALILIVDDVANTGKTLTYAMKPLLDHAPGSIQIAVLVDRQHKAYPVRPDYVGLSLATTLHENIIAELKPNSELVYLV